MLRKRQKVCVGKRVGMIKCILAVQVDVKNDVKVVFIDGDSGWYHTSEITVLNEQQVRAVAIRFGRDVWDELDDASVNW